MRRMLPTLVGLGLGLVALLWGLAALEGIFMDERDQAHAQVQDEREMLAEYARRTLEQRLESMIHAAKEDIEAAAEDPLRDDTGFVLIDAGVQRLPRRQAAAPGEDTPGRALYLRLRRGAPPEGAEPGSPWAHRVQLALEVRDAIHQGDDAAIDAAMRALLRHRARFVLDGALDIPLTLALLDDLVEATHPHPDLMQGLLRDGFGTQPGASIEGLQVALLRRRDRFSRADLSFLAGRVLALSSRSGIEAEDFERRVVSSPGPALPEFDGIDGLVLLDGGRLAATPRPATRLMGVAVDLPKVVKLIAEDMQRRGLLQAPDHLNLPVLGPVVALAEFHLVLDSPRFSAAQHAAEARFRLKSGFVAGSALLALVIVVLAMAFQHRRHRFVELKSDFVATVSHELRTPLASIRLMAETLQRRTRGLSQVRDYPARIIRDIDELSFLVDNILSFNRLDRGRWQPRRSEVPLVPLIEEVHEELVQYGFDDLEVTTEGLDGLVVLGDRELLKLMLRNLAKNACTYNERSPVTLTIWGVVPDATTPSWTIEIEDNGVGIPVGEQRRVFEDFYRAPGTRARGSGLGLSICRKIMQVHGGTIGISASNEAGTSIVLKLPASMVQDPQ